MRRELYVGVMSGTSLDGIDAVLVDFGPMDEGHGCRVLASASRPLDPKLRSELMQLQQPVDDELARAARAANALADAYATAIADVLTRAGVAADDVEAAGVHGQTVRHRPEESWTLQLNNAARIAERCGVTVVADFRSRDLAAGGQGAPLVPAFHAALFAGPTHRVVANVGGIANITDLPPGALVHGFDTGPGNVLMDLWHARHRGGSYDRDGAWARTGRVDQRLLRVMRAEPYFSKPPSKSTGRDLFNAQWLDARLAEATAGDGVQRSPADVQATLVALTAGTIADAIRGECSGATEVLVCGGGAHNAALMDALSAELAPRHVTSTSARGVAAEHVEAMAFAWLARESLAGRESNLPAVTGARAPRVLGAVYHR